MALKTKENERAGAVAMGNPGEDQWILTAEEYADLAAFKGTTLDEELESRKVAALFIQKLGMRLKLPQVAIATAIVLMHRFYIRESFSKFSHLDICPAVTFIASKVDEHPRKIKDVLQASFCVRFKTDSVDGGISFADDSPKYIAMKDRLLALEKIILQTCCFDLTMKHPYNYVFRNVKLLQDKNIEDQLVQSAWVIINESLRTTICIRYPPKAVSAAAIYFAAQRDKIDLNQVLNAASSKDPIDAEMFPHAPKQMVHEIVSILLDLYK